MTNSNEYLEGMLGAYAARVAPFNVNYRYVADELVYLLDNARCDGGDVPRAVRPDAGRGACRSCRRCELIHVDDGSGRGAAAGRGALRGPAGRKPPTSRWTSTLSPDDLYVLYTGGTTGMPKGVLWRQNDIYLNAMGGRVFGTGEPMTSLDGDRRARPAPAARVRCRARR